MSRIGKLPISIPTGVEVKIDGSIISFKKDKLVSELDTKGNVKVELKNNFLNFTPNDNSRQASAFWGTYRALSNNIIIGITTGYEKKLEINGVGYKAAVKGKVLELKLGFSHDINFNIPEGITIESDKTGTKLSIKGADKQEVGQIAAEIRSFRPPEPYKGKGIKYSDETIIRKAGKTGK